jgi:hypothetical protein
MAGSGQSNGAPGAGPTADDVGLTAPLAASADPAAPSSALAAGDRIGDYEIRGLLGIGGMGRVYRAYDLNLDR